MAKRNGCPERCENGQFSESFDAMCKCGQAKGMHMAVAPFDLDDGDLQCAGFKKAKVQPCAPQS